jgi:hypothetical protein
LSTAALVARALVVALAAGGGSALAGCGGEGERAAPPAPGAPLAAGEARRLLARHVPELRYAAAEQSFATDVRALAARAVLRDAAGRVVARAPSLDALAGGAVLDAPSPGLPERGDVAYGHAVRDRTGRVWLQYWLFSTDNLQDRGIVRTGRHEGDWELVQVGLDAARRPATLTLAQHSWAERCAWGRRGARPVVFVANGSHASYATPAVHERPWPDPDDEARGDGRRVVPRLEPIGDHEPGWVGWPGRWGGSNAAWWNPVENGSPRGPALQAAGQWADPAGFHARARGCGAGAPPRPAALTAVAVGLPLAALALLVVRRRRRFRGGDRLPTARRPG